MNRYIHHLLLATTVTLCILAFSGCEVETAAYGTVKETVSGSPVVGAHVMQVAVYKKSQELVSETYTDSTGSFSMDAGPTSFGARKVKLAVIVEKDRHSTTVVENKYGILNIRITHH